MNFAAISDLHGYLPKLNPVDVVLICGDIVPLDVQNNNKKSLKWFEETFMYWAMNLSCEKVIFIAGNHDGFLQEREPAVRELLADQNKIIYLRDELYTLFEDITIYGTPWCHKFGSWWFMYEQDSILQETYDKIPEKVDILLTHDVPYYVNDICWESKWSREHAGNIFLRDAIIIKKPLINLNGHLHSTLKQEAFLYGTKCRNVSLKNEKYQVTYEPYYFELSTY